MDLNEMIDDTGADALERVAAQEGPGWAAAVTRQIECLTGGGIEGSSPYVDKELVTNQLCRDQPMGDDGAKHGRFAWYGKLVSLVGLVTYPPRPW